METNENEDTTVQNFWKRFSISPEREIHCNTSIPQKIRKHSNTQANLALKATGERTANKTPNKRELIKIRAELNEIETRRTV